VSFAEPRLAPYDGEPDYKVFSPLRNILCGGSGLAACYRGTRRLPAPSGAGAEIGLWAPSDGRWRV